VLYTKHNYYIITEFCESGTLQKHIQSNVTIDWNRILLEVSQGCSYLTHKSIVHRDIKPANIFCKEGVWKIGDLGFARYIDEDDQKPANNKTIK
jgi:serine/threonine protein kinase